MKPNFVEFSETELKLVLFSTALMVTVERQIQERDWDIIQSFAEGYWRSEYGDYPEFRKQIIDDIRDLTKDEVTLYETVDGLLTEFNIQFRQEQKDIILGLLGFLFTSEGIPEIGTSSLFSTFVNRLGSEQSGIRKL